MGVNAAFCRHCGKPALTGASFCAYCGKPLAGTTPAPVTPSVKVRRSIARPERGDLAGRCAVIHTGEGPINIGQVGRVVAKATGTPLSDVTRRMRTTKGFVATGLDAKAAGELADELGRMGERVFVLSEGDCIALPPPMRMRRVMIDRNGLDCEAYTWDQTAGLRAPWEEVFLVSTGRLAMERVSELPAEERSSSNPFERFVPNLATDRYNEFLLDIVLFNPWRRLRLDYNMSAYAFQESGWRPEEAFQAVRSCAEGLLAHGRDVPMNRGVALLASRSEGLEWEGLTFLNKLDFDSYTHWLVQLVRYGYEIPG